MHITRTVVLLALLFAGGSVALGQDADQLNMTAYFDSTYTFCDAETLALFWETNVPDAKWTIGYKVRNGYQDQLDDLMRQARQQTAAQGMGCTNTSGFLEYLEGHEEPSRLETREFDQHWLQWEKSGLTFCDAQVLAAMWGISEPEAKAAIGRKITAGYFNEGDLVRARQQVLADGQRCALHQSTFTPDDAHMLAAFWNKPVNEAKLDMEMMLTRGQSALIWDAMHEAKSGVPTGALTKKEQKRANKEAKKEAKRRRKQEKREKAKMW